MRATPFHEMDRLFEQMRRSMDGVAFRAASGYRTANMNVESADDHYLVHADLPGFDPDEIDLRYVDDRLTLEATHEDDGDGGFLRRQVRDEVRLPGVVDVEGIEADYRNGVLEVRLPVEADEGDDSYRIDVD